MAGVSADKLEPLAPSLGLEIFLLSPLGGGGSLWEAGAPQGSFATQPEAPGPWLLAHGICSRHPQLQHATEPRAPALTPGARRGRRLLRGAGKRGAPRGPAAGRGHLRVLLGEAVGRGAGGGEQR